MKAVKIFLCCVIAILIGTTAGIIIVNLVQNKRNAEADPIKHQASSEKIAQASESDAQMLASGGDMVITEVEANQTTEITTEEASTELQLPSEDEQPVYLTSALLKEDVSYQNLYDMGCHQLIAVNSSGSSAEIYVYECNEDGLWSPTELDCSGHVGSNGVSKDSYEGSKMTPGGLFPIRDAFYIEEKPQTGLNTFHVDDNTYWVDDSDSPHYNQLVQLAEGQEKDFNSAEHMIGYYSAYIYGFVIGFNENPIVPGKGSAIFFHVGDNPTMGCVSTSKQHVLDILAFLDAKKNPYILTQ